MKEGGAGNRVPEASTTGTARLQAARQRTRPALVSTAGKLREIVMDHLSDVDLMVCAKAAD
jgi:hypothetical protein